MAKTKQFIGTGRRKTSVARVILTPGKGNILVNNRNVDEYFPQAILVMDLKRPLTLTGNENNFDVTVNVSGGGFTGQAGAIRLGIARALMSYDTTDVTEDTSYRKILKKQGLITRDARKVERKKYGRKKARRSPQFSKR